MLIYGTGFWMLLREFEKINAHILLVCVASIFSAQHLNPVYGCAQIGFKKGNKINFIEAV